jgi:hypothetical protein
VDEQRGLGVLHKAGGAAVVLAAHVPQEGGHGRVLPSEAGAQRVGVLAVVPGVHGHQDADLEALAVDVAPGALLRGHEVLVNAPLLAHPDEGVRGVAVRAARAGCPLS